MPRTRHSPYAPGGWPAAWVLVPTGTTPAAVPDRPRPATPPPAAPVPPSASSLTPGSLLENRQVVRWHRQHDHGDTRLVYRAGPVAVQPRPAAFFTLTRHQVFGQTF